MSYPFNKDGYFWDKNLPSPDFMSFEAEHNGVRGIDFHWMHGKHHEPNSWSIVLIVFYSPDENEGQMFWVHYFETDATGSSVSFSKHGPEGLDFLYEKLIGVYPRESL